MQQAIGSYFELEEKESEVVHQCNVSQTWEEIMVVSYRIKTMASVDITLQKIQEGAYFSWYTDFWGFNWFRERHLTLQSG